RDDPPPSSLPGHACRRARIRLGAGAGRAVVLVAVLVAGVLAGGVRGPARGPGPPVLTSTPLPGLTGIGLPDLAGLQAGAVYAVLFAVIFVESGLIVGFLLPGDSILFTAGLLAAEPASGLSLPVLAVGAFACA